MSSEPIDPQLSTPVARGPYRTGIKRRVEIVHAAAAIFARHGYAGASLRQIGDAVGMTPAGLLRHFDTKEDLLLAVLSNWEDETNALQARTGQAPGIAFFLGYSDLMRYHMNHPGLIELFLTLCAEASNPDHPARSWVVKRYDRITRNGVAHLLAAIGRGEVRSMTPSEQELEVRGLHAAMDGLELQWIADPSLDLAAMFEYLFDTILLRWGYNGPRHPTL